MNKITTFLIVVVLIARGVLYMYDHKKTTPEKVVTIENKTATETAGTTNKPVSLTTLTFLLTDEKDIYYYTGPFNGTLFSLKRDYAGAFIKAYKENMPPDDLMFIIKSDKSATFKSIIDLMDEMHKYDVPNGHYAEGEITAEESEKINLLKNKQK